MEDYEYLWLLTGHDPQIGVTHEADDLAHLFIQSRTRFSRVPSDLYNARAEIAAQLSESQPPIDGDNTDPDSTMDTTGGDTVAEDIEPEDTLVQDTATEDTEPEDTLVQDTATKDTEPEDTEPEDTVEQDMAQQDTVLEDTTEDTEPEDAVVQDSAVQDTNTLDTAVQDSAQPDTAVQDSAQSATVAQDTAVQDSAQPDTVVQDTAVQDTAVQELSGEDTPVEETAGEDTTIQDMTMQDTAVQDTIEMSDSELDDSLSGADLLLDTNENLEQIGSADNEADSSSLDSHQPVSDTNPPADTSAGCGCVLTPEYGTSARSVIFSSALLVLWLFMLLLLKVTIRNNHR